LTLSKFLWSPSRNFAWVNSKFWRICKKCLRKLTYSSVKHWVSSIKQILQNLILTVITFRCEPAFILLLQVIKLDFNFRKKGFCVALGTLLNRLYIFVWLPYFPGLFQPKQSCWIAGQSNLAYFRGNDAIQLATAHLCEPSSEPTRKQLCYTASQSCSVYFRANDSVKRWPPVRQNGARYTACNQPQL
jgi:hypothetical protein